ncbi:MAG: PKD domain-containing protein [Lentisphaerae bacterium]|nr:PKD domain-containing protein [Lentisphaerota bacterium]MBT4822412.1 PKD domain-containing protein [Lentisphaerota bacterium]MBT5612598.1 PKD domain-containing protein [Lentisphaerota bacterium]MBT7059257.1 PKD domain-containing protein [Lentisphaerota bacterium]MBT7845812.1 PKD domain-containing protein [Lentisphaerota bacterium]
MNRYQRCVWGLVLLAVPALHALERTDTEFRIFQFPADRIPRIDGKVDDWQIVGSDYVYGTDQLADTVQGNGTNHDPTDLDVKVRVGWVKGLNRLYFLYEAFDDYWNMHIRRGDIFEVCVDGDLSGGPFIINSQMDQSEAHFRFKGVHAQNYHIFTPPGPGRDWVFVWGCQPWIGVLPYANHAYSHALKEGEGGRLVLEFWITPFDYAPYDGPARAVPSQLVEDTRIGLSWAVLDYDENSSKYEGFWNLSHNTRMDSDASMLCAFRLMPPEPRFLPALHADWSFKILDMDRRLVAFKDCSHGTVDAWLWDFDDGTTSSEQHPIHQYEKPGQHVVTLTIKGPAGERRRIKVFDVVVR